jgi:hypothetical protein
MKNSTFALFEMSPLEYFFWQRNSCVLALSIFFTWDNIVANLVYESLLWNFRNGWWCFSSESTSGYSSVSTKSSVENDYNKNILSQFDSGIRSEDKGSLICLIIAHFSRLARKKYAKSWTTLENYKAFGYRS